VIDVVANACSLPTNFTDTLGEFHVIYHLEELQIYGVFLLSCLSGFDLALSDVLSLS
jgi:hypothetical protein